MDKVYLLWGLNEGIVSVHRTLDGALTMAKSIVACWVGSCPSEGQLMRPNKVQPLITKDQVNLERKPGKALVYTATWEGAKLGESVRVSIGELELGD